MRCGVRSGVSSGVGLGAGVAARWLLEGLCLLELVQVDATGGVFRPLL